MPVTASPITIAAPSRARMPCQRSLSRSQVMISNAAALAPSHARQLEREADACSDATHEDTIAHHRQQQASEHQPVNRRVGIGGNIDWLERTGHLDARK